MLLVDPGTVLDPGFQLSACATAGLIAWSDGLGGRIGRLAPRVPAAVRESLAVSLSAQAATLPIVLLDFGRLSLVSPAANLVVAPLVPFVMAGAAVALPLGALVEGGVPPLLLGLPLALAALPLQLLAGAGHVAASVPYASVQLPPLVALPAAAMTALALAIVARARANGA
jgi:competence protein ComEC